MNPDDVLKKLQSGQTKEWKLKQSGESVEIETDGSEADHSRALEAPKLIISALPTREPQTPKKAPAASVDTAMTLKKCAADYLSEREGEISRSSIITYASSLNKLLKALGATTSIQTIDSQKFVDFRKTLDAKLSIKTVERDCTAFRNLFAWAIERGRYTGVNPVSLAKHSASVRARIQDERSDPINPFSSDDLSKIFDVARYATINKPCSYFLPLLALYTGARINELCSLKLDEIREQDGQAFIKIGTSKTHAGLRSVPLHSALINAGFLQYVEDVRNLKINERLFPHLMPASKNGYGNLPGRDFGCMKKALGLSDDKVFHSFRKTLISCLQFNQCNPEIRKVYVGHAADDGRDVHMSVYSKASYTSSQLAGLVFPHLDYQKWLNFVINTGIVYRPKQFDEFLRKIQSKQIRDQARKSRVERTK